uniref:Uncharacterized protein n=1 Tax=Oryza glumipatula TaxID=40148 RepID=A0A0D9ZH03_9ORYZ
MRRRPGRRTPPPPPPRANPAEEGLGDGGSGGARPLPSFPLKIRMRGRRIRPATRGSPPLPCRSGGGEGDWRSSGMHRRPATGDRIYFSPYSLSAGDREGDGDGGLGPFQNVFPNLNLLAA